MLTTIPIPCPMNCLDEVGVLVGVDAALDELLGKGKDEGGIGEGSVCVGKKLGVGLSSLM